MSNLDLQKISFIRGISNTICFTEKNIGTSMKYLTKRFFNKHKNIKKALFRRFSNCTYYFWERKFLIPVKGFL